MSKSSGSSGSSSRRSKTESEKNQQHSQRPEDVPILDSLFGTISEDWAFLASLGISILSLTATGLILLSQRYRSNQNEEERELQKRKLADAFGTPEGLDVESMMATSSAAASSKGSTKTRGAKKTKDGLEKVSHEYVISLFQKVYAAQSTPEGRQYMEMFYDQILLWGPSQFDPDGRSSICNFLFWYYRDTNPMATGLKESEAEHIRYWADFEISDQTDFDDRQSKYDVLYSLAVLQRSIPHTKQFYQWITSDFITNLEMPLLEEIKSLWLASNSSTKDDNAIPSLTSTLGGGDNESKTTNNNENDVTSNTTTATTTNAENMSKKNQYALTRFQSACILGHWDDVRYMGSIVEILSTRAGKFSKNNAFMNYTIRVVENPFTTADYGQFYKMVDILQKKFPTAILGPATYEEWTIHGCRYKNENPTVSVEENSKYVLMDKSMIDEDGYTVLTPSSRSQGIMGFPSIIRHWGRVCQLISPMVGGIRTALLPMVGCASDSQMYVQFEWLHQVDYDRRLVRKIGKMELERLPSTKTIESTTTFSSNEGYIWEGTLEVTIEKCDDSDESLSMQNAYQSPRRLFGANNNNNGLYTNPYESSSTTTNTSRARGEGVTTTTTTSTNEGKESTTQRYYIEMVIDSSGSNQNDNDMFNDYENQNENETAGKTPRD